MFSWVETLLVFLVLTNLLLLGSSRLATYVRLLAIQGLIISAITLGIHQDELSLRIFMLAIVSAIVKSLFFPWLFFRAITVAHIKREIEPLVGYALSLFLGTLLFGFSSWLSAKLPLPGRMFSSLLVPVSFFMMFTGFFLIIARSKAITQVISYLVIENGIYLFGMTFVKEAPLLAELGILLDVTVGIFVMGIIIHHISREFDSLNVNRLSNLKDWR